MAAAEVPNYPYEYLDLAGSFFPYTDIRTATAATTCGVVPGPCLPWYAGAVGAHGASLAGALGFPGRRAAPACARGPVRGLGSAAISEHHPTTETSPSAGEDEVV